MFISAKTKTPPKLVRNGSFPEELDGTYVYAGEEYALYYLEVS